MNEKERLFRINITPPLRDLAKICRVNEKAFVAVVEIEPGKTVQISYSPEGSTLKQALKCKADGNINNKHFKPESLSERKIDIAKGIRAERG